jgi:hypothetical protein
MKITTEEFIQKVKDVYGDKYNCDIVIYKTSKDKVIITCTKHNCYFLTRSCDLLRGHSMCKECSSKKHEFLRSHQ